MIETARLRLIPSSVELARAEIADRDGFARLLKAEVPYNWPPETLSDALPLFLGWMEAAPDRVGWFGWYALLVGDGKVAPILVGGGGFLGPAEGGTAEMGYSVLPQFQRQGLASEIVGALVKWAMAQPGVTRIVAQTEWANPASVRVLTKVGFVPAGAGLEPEGARFEFTAK